MLHRLQAGGAGIRDYLIQEVHDAQTPEVQEWMLKTAILDRFCAGLCSELCRPEPGAESTHLGGAEFLDQLRRANLFTIPLDVEGHWFRYHHLFQHQLRNQLREHMTVEAVAGLHLRASAWFGDAGLIDEAIEHALAGGDALRAARLIEESRADEEHIGPWYLPAKWLPRLPERFKRDRPGLSLAQAWMLYA